jgi:hypothetical protein
MTVRCACCSTKGEGSEKLLESKGWRAEQAKGIKAWYCPTHAEIVKGGGR